MLYRFDNYVLDTERRELRRGAVVRPIEPQVFDLLEYLVSNRARVVSRDDLLKAIWNGRCVSETALSTRINAARSAIGDNGEEQCLIRTLRRKGFRFIGEVHEEEAEVQAVAINSRDPGKLAFVFHERPAIAVLPFRNYDGVPEQERFADGITEDLITALSNAEWFFVISQRSSFSSQGKAVEIKQIARKLGVRYVLQGSVRVVVNRVYITVHLFDGINGRYLWAERYDQYISDGYALRDDITDKITTAIQHCLFSAEDIRAKCKSPESLNAWECIVRALSLMKGRKKQHIMTAGRLLRNAILLDPKSAQAHSLLAFLTSLSVHMGWKPGQTTLPLALNIADKALCLDPDEPWAHAALGYSMIWKKRCDDAFIAIEKALTLNPDFAMANYLFALASSFFLGRANDAIMNADRGSNLSSSDLLARGNIGVFNNVRGFACFIAGRYREGMDFSRKAIVESPSLTPAYRAYIAYCALAGELEEAKMALQTLKQITPEISLKWIEDTLPFNHTDHRQRYCEAFRMAGLK